MEAASTSAEAMSKEIVEALRAAAREFRTATWAQPADMAVHRRQITQAVLNGEAEYPHLFTYPDFSLQTYSRTLRGIDTTAKKKLHPRLYEAVQRHLDAASLRARTLAGGQDHTYAEAAIQLDGLPTDDLVAEAWTILSEDAPEPAAKNGASAATATELAQRFEKALSNYGLDTWSVQVSPDMSARMSVNGPLRRIRVRHGANFSLREANRLLVHEIGGHVLRWENAARQPEPLALLPLGSTVPTEEGLALWCEYEAGLLDSPALRTYAARTVAVNMAQTKGVLDIASTLTSHVDLPAAVEIAIRVKRGLRNPNSAGGMTKDWGYLGGLALIRSFAESNADGLNVLRGVKWSADHLALAMELHADDYIRTPELTVDETMLAIT